MKIKSLLIVAMCAISFGAFSQIADGTILYWETFGPNGWHPVSNPNTDGDMTANDDPNFAAYKPADGFYFSDQPLHLHGAWSAHPSSAWPNINNGIAIGEEQENQVLGLASELPDADGRSKSLNIKLITSTAPYARFTMAWSTWGTAEVSYSFNNSDWEIMDPDAADVTAYDGTTWMWTEFKENIGGQALVYIRITALTGSPLLIDDVNVRGYNDVPVFKSTLEAAIAAAEDFVSSAYGNPAYRQDAVVELSTVNIVTAQAVATDVSATQDEVDAAVVALNEAVEAVRATALDFTAANEAIGAIAAFKATYLYTGGAAALKAAYDQASAALEAIVASGNVDGVRATQAQVDAAVAAISPAQAALEAQALDFTAANAAVTAAEAFKLTDEYTAWPTEVTGAFDAALAALKAVIAANGVVEGVIISESALAAYITTLEAATQTLISVDGAAIENIFITSALITLPAAANVQIYSASGALVLSVYAAQIDIAGLPAGVYLLKSDSASVSFAK